MYDSVGVLRKSRRGNPERASLCSVVEQHTVAQDWLREQVKGFGALPTERHGLQSSINTLKVY